MYCASITAIGSPSDIRPLWRHYLPGTNAVIFVIDSTDRSRLAEAADALRFVLESDDLRDVKFLLLANKQDVPGCMSVDEIHAALQLDHVASRIKHHTQATVATTGDGVNEGIDWLCEAPVEA